MVGAMSGVIIMKTSFNSATESRFLSNFIENITKTKIKILAGIIMFCISGLALLALSPTTYPEDSMFYDYQSDLINNMVDVQNNLVIEIKSLINEDYFENYIMTTKIKSDDEIIQSMISISNNSISEEKAKSIMYLIKEYSEIYDFNVTTILGLMAQESHYISKAKSKANAKGLMQVTPIALKDYNRYHNTSYIESDLYDDRINIMIGCWTLNRQKKYIDSDNIDECIISYNSGSTNFKNNKSDYLNKYTYLDMVKYYENMFLNIKG